MPHYFNDCYTPDEVKARYRQLAKTMHPDAGGTNSQFRELQEQYEQSISHVANMPKLPPLFHVSGNYEYNRVKVIYFQRDCHWYKFHKEGGADIWIDSDHVYLIKTSNRIESAASSL